MSRAALQFDALPAEIAIFPLSGVLLMPEVQLPLNIFEPRYLAMVDAALAGSRMIGMIQPRAAAPALYPVGCAGRITSFEDTPDGRYLITLTGVCRFEVASELAPDAAGFRRVQPDWQNYRHDVDGEEGHDTCRVAMLDALKSYLKAQGMSCAQWTQMQDIGAARLVATLAVICPFSAEEKQMLLETRFLPDRMKILRGLMEAAVRDGCADQASGGKTPCH